MVDEDLDQAADRILFRLTNLRNLYLEQLKAFGRVNRFPTKRVITIAYHALIRMEEVELKAGFTASEAQWFELSQVPPLPYDHEEILTHSLESLRGKVKQEPIGFNLLPEEFTLLQLQSLYEAILDIQLDKPNFRRKIEKMNLLVDTGKKQTNVAYRAARLYRFDQAVYESFKDKKFVLDF